MINLIYKTHFLFPDWFFILEITTVFFLVNHNKLKQFLLGTVLIGIQTYHYKEDLDQQKYSSVKSNL